MEAGWAVQWSGWGGQLARQALDQRRSCWPVEASEHWEEMEVCGTVVKAETQWRAEELLRSSCPRCSLL